MIQNKDKIKIYLCVVYRVTVHERKQGVSFYHNFIIDDSINNKNCVASYKVIKYIFQNFFRLTLIG